MSSWDINAILLAVLFGGGLWYLWILLRAKQQRDKSRSLPGPPRIPIIGNLHLLMLEEFPHLKLHQLAQKYGPVMSMKLGLVPTVVISSAKAAELFLKTHDTTFAGRPFATSAQYVTYGNKGLLFSQYGSYWRNMRKFCTMELLSASKVESFRQMRREEMRSFLRSLKEAAKVGAVVDMTAKMGVLIEDMSFRMLMGKKLDTHIKSVVEDYHNLLGVHNLADFIPCVETLDLQGLFGRMKKISKVFDGFLEKIIDDHIRNPKDHNSNQKDFIDEMLSLMDTKHTQAEEQNDKIDRTCIKAIILDMVTAAMDTSAITVEWAFIELLRNPKAMKKLQEELRNKFGTGQLVDEGDLGKLEYMDLVLKESMRLHPVAPLLAPHECLEDTTIDGYHVPKKSRLIINAWTIQRDPDVWSSYGDPDKFLPERFIENNIDLRGRDHQLIPFGSGRRGCPGINLGLTVVKLVLGQLLHAFDWELPNGMSPDDLDLTEKPGISVRRADHLLAVPSYRLSLGDNDL